MAKRDKPNKPVIILTVIFLVILISFFLYQFITIRNAHLTFEGYCKWRGLEVVNQSADYGWCKSQATGQEFKMVLYNNRWYLDGDLPSSFPDW